MQKASRQKKLGSWNLQNLDNISDNRKLELKQNMLRMENQEDE